MVPCTHHQGSSAKLGWGGQRKPLALGAGNTVLDLMCVLFVVVLLNDYGYNCTALWGPGPLWASHCLQQSTPEQKSAC